MCEREIPEKNLSISCVEKGISRTACFLNVSLEGKGQIAYSVGSRVSLKLPVLFFLLNLLPLNPVSGRGRVVFSFWMGEEI